MDILLSTLASPNTKTIKPGISCNCFIRPWPRREQKTKCAIAIVWGSDYGDYYIRADHMGKFGSPLNSCVHCQQSAIITRRIIYRVTIMTPPAFPGRRHNVRHAGKRGTQAKISYVRTVLRRLNNWLLYNSWHSFNVQVSGSNEWEILSTREVH